MHDPPAALAALPYNFVRPIGFLRCTIVLCAIGMVLLQPPWRSAFRGMLLLVMPHVLLWLYMAYVKLRDAAAEATPESLQAATRKRETAGETRCAPSSAGAVSANGRTAAELPTRRDTPAMPPLHMWGEPEGTSYLLRGGNYMVDGVKKHSQASLFSLVALDTFIFDDPQDRYNIASRPDNWLAQVPPFTLVLNVIIPSANNLCLVAYFQPTQPEKLENLDIPAVDLFWKWVRADNAFRNERLKLIPRVGKGPYLIRSGVGAKPVLLGKKLAVQYHSTPTSIEVDLDISSNTVADTVTRMVRDAMANSVCLDLAITLEGRAPEELPECMLGALRCDHIDFRKVAVAMPPRSTL